jgi:hypothetical protein
MNQSLKGKRIAVLVGRDQSFGSSSTSAETDPGARGTIASVTLAVTAEQARQLAEARRTGELDVLLLPPPEVAHPRRSARMGPRPGRRATAALRA